MRTVTQNIKIELESAEKFALSEAKCILQNFVDIMKNHNCYNAYFEQFDAEYDKSDLESAIDLLDSFSDDNPTIE